MYTIKSLPLYNTDMNECVMEHNCSVNANCTNLPGSYMCTCTSGYNGTGFICDGTKAYIPTFKYSLLRYHVRHG